jgi:hypothetical protein
VVASVAGALVNRVGERPLVAGGLLLRAAGMAWIGLLATPGLAYPKLVARWSLPAPASRWRCPPRSTPSWGSVASAELGKASGTFNMLRFLGGVFGVAILVAVFASAGSYGSGQAFSHGFGPGDRCRRRPVAGRGRRRDGATLPGAKQPSPAPAPPARSRQSRPKAGAKGAY